MGNLCCKLERKKNKHQKKLVLLLLGLDNAGKTVAVKSLAGEDKVNVLPTIGFSAVNLHHEGHLILIYDLGGGEQIRDIWHRYFVDVHGIIFVIDSSDAQRLSECEDVLNNILSHEKLIGKPLLLLANKQDCEGALDEIDIVEQLHIENIVNKYECPTRIETCSAQHSNIADTNILNGYHWILNYILSNFDELNSRVQKDMAQQNELDLRLKKARLKSKLCRTSEDKLTEEPIFTVSSSLTSRISYPDRPHSSPLEIASISGSPEASTKRPKSALERVREQLEIHPHSVKPKRKQRNLTSLLSIVPKNKVGVL